MVSPTLKSFGERQILAGKSCLVVDLEHCVAMDSTFMGTLAGLAGLIEDKNQGVLQIVGADEKLQTSFQDLGLDFLIEINPTEAIWSGKEAQIRSELTLEDSTEKPSSQLLLEAHEVLSEAHPDNVEKFSTTVEMLRLQAKKEL